MKKNLLRRLCLIVIAVMLGLNVYHWNANSLVGNELPMPFGYGTAIVLSGSMEPTLSVDDLVVIRQTEAIEVGDIIIYHDGRSLVIHRVTAIDGEAIQTQGDANNVPDQPISKEAVKGVMVLNIPNAGTVVEFMRRPVMVILLLVIGVLLIERGYRREKQKNQTELDELEDEIRKLMAEIKDDSK